MGTNKQKIQAIIPQYRDERLGIERRRFSYDAHIPERRSGQDRRIGGARQEDAAESYNELALG